MSNIWGVFNHSEGFYPFTNWDAQPNTRNNRNYQLTLHAEISRPLHHMTTVVPGLLRIIGMRGYYLHYPLAIKHGELENLRYCRMSIQFFYWDFPASQTWLPEGILGDREQYLAGVNFPIKIDVLWPRTRQLAYPARRFTQHVST